MDLKIGEFLENFSENIGIFVENPPMMQTGEDSSDMVEISIIKYKINKLAAF